MKSFLCQVLCVAGCHVFSQAVRPPFDKVGFVWTPEQVEALVQFVKTNGTNLGPDGTTPVAGICPHDDYLLAGDISLPLLSRIKAKEVVIFGVTHRTARELLGDPKNILIMDNFEKWEAPYGPVSVSPLREVIKSKLDAEKLVVSNKGHINEHSIESMIPLLQYFDRDMKITPIMVTAMDYEDMMPLAEQLGTIIADYMKENGLEAGKDVFFLFSSDANHYGPDFKNVVYGEGMEGHRKGIAADRKIAETHLEGQLAPEKVKGFLDDPDQKQAYWCGRYSISFGLLTTANVMNRLGNKPLNGEILAYSDSCSHGVLPIHGKGFGITAPFSPQHWVGHLSLLYR